MVVLPSLKLKRSEWSSAVGRSDGVCMYEIDRVVVMLVGSLCRQFVGGEGVGEARGPERSWFYVSPSFLTGLLPFRSILDFLQCVHRFNINVFMT
jgi:hypothetical protein